MIVWSILRQPCTLVTHQGVRSTLLLVAALMRTACCYFTRHGIPQHGIHARGRYALSPATLVRLRVGGLLRFLRHEQREADATIESAREVVPHHFRPAARHCCGTAGGCVCPPSVAPPPLRSSSSGRGKTRRRRRRANALAWRTWCAARDPWLASHTHAVRCRSCAERAAPSRSRSPRMRSWRTCCPTRTTFRLVRAHRMLLPTAARHAAARAAAGCRAVRRVIVIPRAPLRAGRTVARGHTQALPMRCARSMSH